MTDEGAQAPAATGRSAKKNASKPKPRVIHADAENLRHGDAELPRADARDAIESEDERDSLYASAADLSEEEFLELVRSGQVQSVLPNLPKIPGHHTCWATTTNPRDSIAGRLRLGYTVIKYEDIPGWDGASIKTGDYVGCVGINEMIAMKIPQRRYQIMMAELHHRAPMAEEEKIRAVVEQHGENALRDKGRIIDETDGGFGQSIVQKAPVQEFA